MASQGGELLLGRDAIVAPSIAERIRDKAASIIEASAGGGGGKGDFVGDDAVLVDDAVARRRVAMFLAVVAPLLFVAAIIASAALVGEPNRDDVAAASRAAETDVLQQPVTVAAPVLAAGAGIDPPVGMELASMALDGSRIALHFRGEKSQEIVIYDLASGAPEARLPIKASVPATSAMALQPILPEAEIVEAPQEPLLAAIEPPSPSRKPIAAE
jgi:hypothetical protein